VSFNVHKSGYKQLFKNHKGETMLTIKVLGPGCDNCKKVEAVARNAVNTLGLEAQIEKITDRAGIMKYPILSTPGLVINEKLVCAGRIPNEAEVTTWLTTALESVN
jgi:small redox-active disulfide protein 2